MELLNRGLGGRVYRRVRPMVGGIGRAGADQDRRDRAAARTARPRSSLSHEFRCPRFTACPYAGASDSDSGKALPGALRIRSETNSDPADGGDKTGDDRWYDV